MANEKSEGSQPLSTETGQPQLVAKSPDAVACHRRFDEQWKESMTEIESFPLTVLVWGPDDSSELFTIRIAILNALRGMNQNADMSENIVDSNSTLSILDQEYLQAVKADAVFVLCCSNGPNTEVASFAANQEIVQKMVVFLDSAYQGGFFAKGPLRLLQANGGVVIEYESPSDITSGQLWRRVEEWLRNLQFEAWKRANRKS